MSLKNGACGNAPFWSITNYSIFSISFDMIFKVTILKLILKYHLFHHAFVNLKICLIKDREVGFAKITHLRLTISRFCGFFDVKMNHFKAHLMVSAREIHSQNAIQCWVFFFLIKRQNVMLEILTVSFWYVSWCTGFQSPRVNKWLNFELE